MLPAAELDGKPLCLGVVIRSDAGAASCAALDQVLPKTACAATCTRARPVAWVTGCSVEV